MKPADLSCADYFLEEYTVGNIKTSDVHKILKSNAEYLGNITCLKTQNNSILVEYELKDKSKLEVETKKAGEDLVTIIRRI